MNQRAIFISIARSFLGVWENSADFIDIVKHYNAIKPLPRGYKLKLTDEWCAAFLSSVAQMVNKRDFPYECSAHRMMLKTKQVTNPEVGDLIFYDWNGDKWCDHVGMVTKVNKRTIKVIEGNNNSRVIERTVNIGDPKIRCFGRIPWAKESVSPKNLTDDQTYIKLAKECIAGKYGNGITRQKKLTEMGYDYKLVQEYVNKIFLENK